MSDDDFPLNPGTAVTNELLWSGLVVLAERVKQTRDGLADHRDDSRRNHTEVITRMSRLEQRVSTLERTSLTEAQLAYIAASQQQTDTTTTNRAEIVNYVLKIVAAAIALLIIGIILTHLGLPVTGFGTPSSI